MRTALIIVASLLFSGFVLLFQPNEFAWMRNEFGKGQLHEDSELMFKIGGALFVNMIVQAVCFAALGRSGHKRIAFALAAVAVAATGVLFLRI